MLGLRFCARASSSCGKRGPVFIAVRGPLTIAASPVAEHRLQTRRLSSCGSRTQLLRGMWDPPRPGLEPVSPALAGRFSTTAHMGSPLFLLLTGRMPSLKTYILFSLNVHLGAQRDLETIHSSRRPLSFPKLLVSGTLLRQTHPPPSLKMHTPVPGLLMVP